MYDKASGDIMYSLCNSDSNPIFPANESAAFALDSRYPPVNGTSVAGLGYQTSGGIDIAIIVYQTESMSIIQSQWQCNSTTGQYSAYEVESEYSWDISAHLTTPYNGTGLAILNLGDADDTRYRVYFKDYYWRTAALRYEPGDDWYYDGLLTPDEQLSLELAASHQGENNITLMSPSISTAQYETIEVCNLESADTWDITTFPLTTILINDTDSSDALYIQVTNNTNTSGYIFGYDVDQDWTLDAFDGYTASVAVFVSDNLTQNVFYIGTDKYLHGLSGLNATWNKFDTQENEKWPLADDASAALALTYDTSNDRVWIYYMSDGNLTQVHRSDADTWEDAIVLSKTSNVTETTVTSSSSSGFSTGAKIGTGVGVGVGAVVIAGLAFVLFRFRRSKKNNLNVDTAAAASGKDKDASNPAAGPLLSPSTVPGSPAPAYMSGYWQNGEWVAPQADQRYSYYDQTKPENNIAHEMYAPPPSQQVMYELPHEEHAHEMAIEGHQVAEMPTEVYPAQGSAAAPPATQSDGHHLAVQYEHEPDAAEMQHARLSMITPEPAR
ncbi:hypothetical protein PFICI_06631 [Pestalotiopsis fici W106-1]|uniref:Fucose-specific lectin n=1 Tax=Pestalotiopsis fici (strain W106-1 / CGMCC3.15140) TaxID=1229662 RepID=W3X6F9_PESFW|nr:uncharacterized protein PFICI_06631 [Pestalotiopsis fici W106-1]ETS81629.1 hypothetical protein PFICI_06631 [Pestalotiopsis fici W106-1]